MALGASKTSENEVQGIPGVPKIFQNGTLAGSQSVLGGQGGLFHSNPYARLKKMAWGASGRPFSFKPLHQIEEFQQPNWS